MQVITSKDNEMIKEIKKLKEKKYRDQEEKYIIEGIKLVKEAIEEKAKISKIVVCEDCINDGSIEQSLMYEIARFDCIGVTEKIFKTLTDVATPQGILAVIEKNTNGQIDFNEDIIVILDGINLKQIILSENTADPYNPKVVRSTMGAIFRINIIESKKILETLKEIKKNKFRIMATSLDTEESIYSVDYKKKVIIIGNEANGVSKEILDLADEKVKIPMLGKTESLNVAVATGVILYEYVRRKEL